MTIGRLQNIETDFNVQPQILMSSVDVEDSFAHSKNEWIPIKTRLQRKKFRMHTSTETKRSVDRNEILRWF